MVALKWRKNVFYSAPLHMDIFATESDEQQGKNDLQIKFILLRKWRRSRPIRPYHNKNKKAILMQPAAYGWYFLQSMQLHTKSIHITTEDWHLTSCAAPPYS